MRNLRVSAITDDVHFEQNLRYDYAKQNTKGILFLTQISYAPAEQRLSAMTSTIATTCAEVLT